MKKLIVFLLLAALGLQLCGCSQPQASPENTEAEPAQKTADGAKTVNLTASVTAAPVAAGSVNATASQSASDFSVRLLQNAYHGGENCILSPNSVLTAMAMVANGADGETLSQLEAAFGLSVGELNAFNLPGFPVVGELYPLCGALVNLSCPLPSGESVRLLDDRKIYLGTRVQRAEKPGRWYGVAADEDLLFVCEFGEKGENPEIVLLRRRSL